MFAKLEDLRLVHVGNQLLRKAACTQESDDVLVQEASPTKVYTEEASG